MKRFKVALWLSLKTFWCAMRGNACAWTSNGPSGNWCEILEGRAIAYNQALAGTLLEAGARESWDSYQDSIELDAEEAVKELIGEH